MHIVTTHHRALSLRARGVRAILAAWLSFAMALVYSLGPDGIPLTSCRIREITGISCLTCGLTRSLHASTHGDFLSAFSFHLLGPLLFCGMLCAVMIWIQEAVAGNRLVVHCHAALKKHALAGVGIISVFYGVVRAIWEVIM